MGLFFYKLSIKFYKIKIIKKNITTFFTTRTTDCFTT